MWRWAWFVPIVALSGCATARYRPVDDTWQPVSQGRLRVVGAVRRSGGQDDELTLETELGPGTRLLRIGGAGGDDVCVSAVAPLQVIDGVPRYELEPPSLDGKHTVTIDLGPDLPRAALETEVHGVRHCDEFQLAWPARWEREPFWYTDLRIAFVGLVPRFSVGGLRLLVARWHGNRRLGAEVGLAGAVVCGDDEDCPDRFALPLGGEAMWFVRPDGEQPLFLGAGARLGSLWAQRAPGSALSLHAITLQLGVEALVGQDLHGSQGTAPAGPTLGLGLNAGPSLFHGAAGTGLGWALGGSLDYGLTL